MCASKKWISLTLSMGLVCFVSYLKTFTIWYTLMGRSPWLFTQRAKMGYMAVSDVGLRTSFTSSSVSPPLVTQ